MQEDLERSLKERHCPRDALHADSDIDLLNYKNIDHPGDKYCDSSSRHFIKNKHCTGNCHCVENTSFSDTETIIESIEREPSPPPTTSEQCSWKSVDEGHHRIFSSHIKGQCVFPFKSTPGGNLKVVPKQVVFESKKVSVLVADPGQAKVNIKADINEPKKLLKSLEGTECSCHSVMTKPQRYDNMVDDSRCELYLHSMGYGKYEPVDWSKVVLPQKSDLVALLLHRIVNSIKPDIVIYVGNKKFQCHLLVLQCYSAYFENCSCGEYKLPEAKVTSSAFVSIYKWMVFTQSDSQHLLQRDNILEVLNAAQFLGIKELKEQCWSFLNNNDLFSEDKAFILYLQAKKMGNTTVKELMASRIMQFFLILVSSRDFLELSVEELCFLLSSSHICVPSEIEVFMSAVRWLMADWDHRRKHVYNVMKCVRFGLVAPWQLVDIRRNPDNPEFMEVTAFPDVQQMIEDGLAYAIIKYWYGNQSEDYYHWIDLLGLEEPSARNWYGDPKDYVTYREFLKDLDAYREQQIVERKTWQKEHQSLASQAKPAVLSHDKDNGDKATLESIHSFLPPNLAAVIPSPATDQLHDAQSVPTVEEFLMHRKLYVKTETKNCALYRAEGDFNKSSSSTEEMQPEKEKRACSVPARVLEFESILRKKNSKQDPKAPTLNNMNDNQKYACNENFLQKKFVKQSCSMTTAIADHESSKSRSSETQFSCSSTSRELTNMQKVASILEPVFKNYLTDASLFFADHESVLIFGGVGPHDTYNRSHSAGKNIYRYHPQDDSWVLTGEMPEPKHHHGMAFLRGRVYIAGGVDPCKITKNGKSFVTNTVWSIDPVSRTWYNETSMLTARQNFGLTAYKGRLYAIGGEDANGRILSSVERFNPTTSVWEFIAPLEVGRMGIAVTKYQGDIWIAGGMTSNRKVPASRSVECYDARNDVWIPNTPLRLPRCFSCLFVMEDKLYLVGGAGRFDKKIHSFHSMADIDVWDSENKEWHLVTEMANPRHTHTIAYLRSQMLIIGGVTTEELKVLTSVERYCCKTNKLVQGVCSLPATFSGHGTVTLPPASLM